jgi:hypothetical protein
MSTIAVGQLTYRPFRDEDVPGLLRLWQDDSGWGELTADKWRRWYVETPFEPALVTVAVDSDGEIVAQEVFTPTRVQLGDQVVSALRLSAPILRQDLRHKTLNRKDHPVIGLFLTAMEAARDQGYGLVYAFPDAGWLRFFRWSARAGLPYFAGTKFPCVETRLPPESPALASDLRGRYSARLVSELAGWCEVLWNQARKSFPINCGILRSSEWLNYRVKANLNLLIVDRDEDSAAGYVSINPKSGLIADIQARRPDLLEPVIATAIDRLCGQTPVGVDRVKAMQTPYLADALSRLAFRPVDFQFAFVCHSQDPDLPSADDLLKQWYATPAD